MTTLCYSVRLQSLRKISDKCYKAVAFDGSEALIPSRFVFGEDYSVCKSDAYWIAAWILEKKSLQYSSNKKAHFTDSGQMIPEITIKDSVPEKVAPKENNLISELKR